MPEKAYPWHQPGEITQEGLTYQEALISFIASRVNPDTQELEAPFSSRQVLERIREFVRIARSDSRVCSDIIENSYIHKNGFRKVVLAKEAGFALRFHFLSADDGDENIHDQQVEKDAFPRADGELTAEYFNAVEDGVTFTKSHLLKDWQRH